MLETRTVAKQQKFSAQALLLLCSYLISARQMFCETSKAF